MRLFFFFVFSAVFWCSHCVGAGGVLPSSAHQFCWAFGICSFFVPSTIMLLTVATCAAVSKVSSCLSLHVGSPHTTQNLYCLQFVVWSPSADNVDSVIVLWAHMSSPRLMHPCCWVMAPVLLLEGAVILGVESFLPLWLVLQFLGTVCTIISLLFLWSWSFSGLCCFLPILVLWWFL